MTIARIYPAGWSVGEKLTSAQMNGVDINTTYALDKRAGQADTLGSLVRCTGIGRLVDRYAAGANADTTYLVSGNTYIDAAGLTNGRIYTLSNTNATAGDVVTIVNRSNFNLIVNDNGGSRLIVLNKSFGDSGNVGGGNLHFAVSGESYWAEFLYTGSAWVLWKSSKQNALSQFLFTSDGSLVVPWSCTAMLAIACGGGGGGAAGDPSRSANLLACGGSGGGGAIERMVLLSGLVPGETLDITIGQGGGGGLAGSPPESGNSGSDSKVVRDSDASVLATWIGAAGGNTGPDNLPFQGRGPFLLVNGDTTQVGTSLAQYSVAAGGAPFRSGGGAGVQCGHSTDPLFLQTTQPQQGGRGFSGGNGGSGAQSSLTILIGVALVGLPTELGGSSPSGNFGGSCGAAGAASGSAMGGGGGGGGGAGPYGVGGDGGAGRDGGSGTAGGNGIAPGANTGAGGGGGGASGGYGSAVNGGGGGNGAAGQMVLIPIR